MATKTPNYPQRARNGFNPQSPNFDAFSSAVKGLPLILPDGRILLYLNFPDDKDCGIACLGESDSYNILVAKSADKMQVGLSCVRGFYGDWTPKGPNNEYLMGNSVYWDMDQFFIEAYPIPYEAALGVDKWLGCSAATGTGTLQAQLANTRRNAFANKPKWSLDSDQWAGKAWSNNIYSLRDLRLSYVGLTPDPGNMMPG